MKKIGNYAVSALSVTAIVFSVATFCEIKAEPKEPEVQEMSVATAVQPVDLTYAAEKALPTVVHIKYVQNSKIQTVEVQSDPFDDFFSDPFGGFFGRGQRGQGVHANSRYKHLSAPPRVQVSSSRPMVIS